MPGKDAKGTRVFVVGVGMSPFVKPKKVGQPVEGKQYEDFVETAVTRALDDCGLNVNDIEQACVGKLDQTAGTGQRSLYRLGFHDIPVKCRP